MCRRDGERVGRRLKVKELRSRFGFGGADRERSVSYGLWRFPPPHVLSDWPVNIGLIIHRWVSVTCVEWVGQKCIHYTSLLYSTPHYATLSYYSLYGPAESLNDSRVSVYLACTE